MAKARLKYDPNQTTFEPVGKIIVSAWMKALPDKDGDAISPLNEAELSLAFSTLLDVPCKAVLDTANLIHIPIPPIPAEATSKTKLIEYLHKKFDDSNKNPAMGDLPKDYNPFNPKNTNKHGSPPGNKKRTFMEDFGDAILFGCGR